MSQNLGNPNRIHKSGFREMFITAWVNRRLLLQLVHREINGRYRGSMMGLVWSIVNPLLMLAVYTFVFSVVFQARWGTDGEQGRLSFALFVFIGLIIHGLFAECTNRAPTLILANSSYVKKVVFPLEILPLVTMGSSLFHAMISVFVFLAFQGMVSHGIPWSALFFPLVLMPLVIGTIGISWFLASLGVFVRDISQATGPITLIILFLSPVFYPVSMLPEKYQYWMHFNPLTFFLEEGRRTIIVGIMPDWVNLFFYLCGSLLLAWGGFIWFQKTRKGFADVI